MTWVLLLNVSDKKSSYCNCRAFLLLSAGTRLLLVEELLDCLTVLQEALLSPFNDPSALLM